jgi:dihydrofolate reductase
MRISIAVAMSLNHAIGTDKGLPWHLPRELKHFRALTTGKPIILGRKTFEHIGRPLPDRANIVLTRRPNYAAEGIRAAHSIDEGLEIAHQEAKRLGADEIMVIGGEEIFRAYLPRVERLYITVVGAMRAGTRFFPTEQLAKSSFIVTGGEHFTADAKNPHPYTVWQLDRSPDGTPGSELRTRLGLQ